MFTGQSKGSGSSLANSTTHGEWHYVVFEDDIRLVLVAQNS